MRLMLNGNFSALDSIVIGRRVVEWPETNSGGVFMNTRNKMALGLAGDAVLGTLAGIILAPKTGKQARAYSTPGLTSCASG